MPFKIDCVFCIKTFSKSYARGRTCYYVCLGQVLATFDLLDPPKTSKTQKI